MLNIQTKIQKGKFFPFFCDFLSKKPIIRYFCSQDALFSPITSIKKVGIVFAFNMRERLITAIVRKPHQPRFFHVHQLMAVKFALQTRLFTDARNTHD